MFLIKIVTGQPTMDLTPSYESGIFPAIYTSKPATIFMIACFLLAVVFVVAHIILSKTYDTKTDLIYWSITLSCIATTVLIGKLLASFEIVSPVIYGIAAGGIVVLGLRAIGWLMFSGHRKRGE